MTAEEAQKFKNVARELEIQAEHIRLMTRKECTHYYKNGNLATLPDHSHNPPWERCVACDAVISRNVNGDIIRT